MTVGCGVGSRIDVGYRSGTRQVALQQSAQGLVCPSTESQSHGGALVARQVVWRGGPHLSGPSATTTSIRHPPGSLGSSVQPQRSTYCATKRSGSVSYPPAFRKSGSPYMNLHRKWSPRQSPNAPTYRRCWLVAGSIPLLHTTVRHRRSVLPLRSSRSAERISSPPRQSQPPHPFGVYYVLWNALTRRALRSVQHTF